MQVTFFGSQTHAGFCEAIWRGILALVFTDGVGAAMRDSGWGLIPCSPSDTGPRVLEAMQMSLQLHCLPQLSWHSPKDRMGTRPQFCTSSSWRWATFHCLLNSKSCIDLGYLQNNLVSFQSGTMTTPAFTSSPEQRGRGQPTQWIQGRTTWDMAVWLPVSLGVLEPPPSPWVILPG